jgi:membrane protease YdiL (CAAX protease family)
VKQVILLSVVALLLWMVMFSPWTAHYVNFWLMMSISAVVLLTVSTVIQRKDLSEIYRFKPSYILVGIFSAFVLYMVFFVGNFAASQLLSFARGQINAIYDLRKQSTPVVIGFLVFLIGPAEEIFWRGVVQYTIAQRWDPLKGYLLVSLLYALVHIWAFNFMLIMAALVCGLFWGFIYMKYRSLWPVIISHALWDLFIFVLLPVH